MILDDNIPELKSYKSLEANMPLKSRSELSSLVVFGSNEEIPVHRWFRFKEGFSASLLNSLLSEFGDSRNKREISLLDPFCGVGTTLVSAQLADRKIRAIGIERNPFIQFVAQTKLRWPELRPESFLDDGIQAIIDAEDINPRLPLLSSIRKGRCISTHTAKRLLAIRNSIPRSRPHFDFLSLGIAAAIEPLSKVRRDGRALRIVDKPRRVINHTLCEIWDAMAQDVISLKKSFPSPPFYPVILGDGRNPKECGVEEDSIDLIITSPPYPNNIDYSEVYKLELWLLEFISSQDEFLSLRHSTFASHPTYNKARLLSPAYSHEVCKGSLGPVLGKLLKRIGDSDHDWRARLLDSYFSDLWCSLESYNAVLRRGGVAIFVVGNSLHGTDFPALVATDLILAKMAECHGFKIEQLAIARGLKRRLSGNHFLRESIVVLKKSDGH